MAEETLFYIRMVGADIAAGLHFAGGGEHIGVEEFVDLPRPHLLPFRTSGAASAQK